MSLRDQLLKSGIATQSQHQRVRTEKKQQAKKKSKVKADSKQDLTQASREKQKERDKILNQQRDLERQQKAVGAEVKQWISQHAVARREKTEAYRFIHLDKVKTLWVSKAQLNDLIRGTLSIVSVESDRYELVLHAIALKIFEKIPEAVIVNHRDTVDSVNSDPDQDYAGYDIPDDLMW